MRKAFLITLLAVVMSFGVSFATSVQEFDIDVTVDCVNDPGNVVVRAEGSLGEDAELGARGDIVVLALDSASGGLEAGNAVVYSETGRVRGNVSISYDDYFDFDGPLLVSLTFPGYHGQEIINGLCL